MKIVTDLSKEFHPVPKSGRNKEKTAEKSGRKRTKRRLLHNA